MKFRFSSLALAIVISALLLWWAVTPPAHEGKMVVGVWAVAALGVALLVALWELVGRLRPSPPSTARPPARLSYADRKAEGRLFSAAVFAGCVLSGGVICLVLLLQEACG